MGMWSSIARIGGGALGGMVGGPAGAQIGQQLAGGIAGKFSGEGSPEQPGKSSIPMMGGMDGRPSLMDRGMDVASEKIFKPKSMRQKGEDAKEYMDAMYPGTTAVERLTGSSGGASSIQASTGAAKIHERSSIRTAKIAQAVPKAEAPSKIAEREVKTEGQQKTNKWIDILSFLEGKIKNRQQGLILQQIKKTGQEYVNAMTLGEILKIQKEFERQFQELKMWDTPHKGIMTAVGNLSDKKNVDRNRAIAVLGEKIAQAFGLAGMLGLGVRALKKAKPKPPTPRRGSPFPDGRRYTDPGGPGHKTSIAKPSTFKKKTTYPIMNKKQRAKKKGYTYSNDFKRNMKAQGKSR